MLVRMWRKGNSFALLVGTQIGAATVESSIWIPQKIKNGSVFWPSNLTSGNISEGTHNTNSKEHKSPYIHCSVIHNHQDVTAAQMSISRWVDQTTMRHLHNGYYLALKKKKILPFVTVWMDLGNSMLGELSQSKKDKYHMISLICGI